MANNKIITIVQKLDFNHYRAMEKMNLNKLMLKTAFACMACDGEIAKEEIALIKKLHHNEFIFGELNIDQEMKSLVKEINVEGTKFLKTYFDELTTILLTENDELKLIEVAIRTIKSDNKIEYSEIKFFKVIRSKLKISNESILAIYPDFEEYIEKDILSESYLKNLVDSFIEENKMNQFDFLIDINFEIDSIIDSNE